MAEFGLVKSFNIDGGELDGFTPQECFVLGYELGMLDYLLKSAPYASISLPVHAANRERIVQSCQDAGRRSTIAWMLGDKSESWMQLDVWPVGCP